MENATAANSGSKLVQVLSQYAHYHRDKRNILTHFFGVPMIVLGVQVLLARFNFTDSAYLSLLWLSTIAASLYYLRLELAMGALMTLLLAVGAYVAMQFASLFVGAWWMIGGALFAIGWLIQFIGHYFEGKKPAFVDDLIGLLIGPLFVCVELLFLLKLRPDLEAAITERAGHTHIREF
jgi:uncharacterized membrane protein YGL010W